MIRICAGWVVALTLLSGCERPDVRFPQFIQDDLVVWTITWELGMLLDDELTAQPVGDTSFTATCAGGGSVQVAGTKRADGTADLSLVLNDCAIDYVDAEETSAAHLTIAGPMTFAFETDDATGFPSQTIHSDELEISGALMDGGEDRELNDVCAISTTFVATDVSTALLGRVCGRDTTSSMAHVSCGP